MKKLSLVKYILIVLPILPVFIPAGFKVGKVNIVEYLINVYPIIIILCLIYKYGISNHNAELRRPSDHNANYGKPLTFLASAAFGIISLIIGLQSSILSEYNNSYQNYNRFKWFLSYEILKFPFEQYKLANEEPSAMLKDTTTLNNNTLHVFIIDKTKSNKSKNTYDIYSKSIDSFLSNEMRSVYAFSESDFRV